MTRLARHCSTVGIAPEAVGSETLLGLYEALEAESLTKDPRQVVGRVVAEWNGFARKVPGWPQAVLASPWKREPEVFPMARFPESFWADVAAWAERMGSPRTRSILSPCSTRPPSPCARCAPPRSRTTSSPSAASPPCW